MINKTHTSCKNCVFAIYDEITQTGCHLNLIKNFKKHKIKVLEAFDEEKEFYVIDNSKCVHMRLENWTGSSLSLEEQKIQVTKEANLHFHVLIVATDNIEDIQKTLNSLAAQELPPTYITIIRQVDCAITPSKLVELCSLQNIQWRVENLMQPYDNIEDVYNLVVPFIKGSIYTIFQAGFEVPPQTLKDISSAIVDNFLKFAIILPNKDGNGYTTLKTFNEYYQNYSGNSLKEKLEQDQCPKKLFIPITKLLPYFPK
jgi:hypothetical protein